MTQAIRVLRLCHFHFAVDGAFEKSRFGRKSELHHLARPSLLVNNLNGSIEKATTKIGKMTDSAAIREIISTPLRERRAHAVSIDDRDDAPLRNRVLPFIHTSNPDLPGA
jgi:hypothetical protein